MKQKPRLTKKEKLFCIYYADCFDAALSAKKAGFKDDCERTGLVMLADSRISQQIVNVLKSHENVASHMTISAFEKLSLQSIADAVSLLYMDNPSKAQLENMRLLNISEIKKLKDGAMEIKFFDRLKSLSSIAMSKNEDNSTVNGLVEALCMGAQKLYQSECDDDGV